MILFIDIETVPSTVDYKTLEVVVDARLKDAEKIAKDIEEKQFEEWKKEALQIHKAKIVCISAIVQDEGMDVAKETFVSDNERNLMTDFNNWIEIVLTGEYNLFSEVPICGHNVRNFDIPMLLNRARKYELTATKKLLTRDKWDKKIFDTMEIWAGTAVGLKTSLSNIADFFEIENHKKTGVSKNVWELANEGKWVEIAEHCEKDVNLTREVFYRL